MTPDPHAPEPDHFTHHVMPVSKRKTKARRKLTYKEVVSISYKVLVLDHS